MPLQVTHRPKSLDDIIGNEAAIESLGSVLSREKDVPPSFFFTGLPGCLRGDTIIFDPITKTNISVRDRWKAGKSFNVFSFSSSGKMVIAQALPPVQYPEDQMFCVKTTESVFYVTNGHQFLSYNGEYLSLKELIENGYEEVPLLSTLVPYLKAPHPNESHYLQKELDFLDDYLTYPHSYDELLPLKRANDQESFPLQDGVQEHNHDLGTELIYNHFYQLFFLLSNHYSFPYTCYFFPLLMSLFSEENYESDQPHNKSDFLTIVESCLSDNIQKPNDLAQELVLAQKFLNLDFSYIHPLASSFSSVCLDCSNESIGKTTIKQITEVSQEEYFDFHVPIYNNYWANGLFHHNCGKTTIARIIKEHLNISDMDFYEYNAANTRGIDTIRQITNNCVFAPMGGDKKLYLLDEVHMQTGYSLQAILKLLEEPPKHVHFALCTSEPEIIKPKLLKALRRRCHECELKPLMRSQIVKLLKSVCKKEETDFPVAVLRKIAKSCWGSAGQALSMLDSVIDISDESTAEEVIENLVVSESSIVDICKLLIDNKLSAINKWHNIKKLLKTLNGEPETIRYAILGYLNQVLLNSSGLPIQLASIVSCFTDSFMYTGKAGVTLACFFACIESESESDIPF